MLLVLYVSQNDAKEDRKDSGSAISDEKSVLDKNAFYSVLFFILIYEIDALGRAQRRIIIQK